MRSKIFSEVAADDRARAIARVRCGLAQFLEGQKPGDALEFMKLIVGSEVTVPSLLRALARRGYNGTRSTLYYHRTYLCLSCTTLRKKLRKKS